MENIESLWEKVLNRLEVSMGAVSFELWVKSLEVLDYMENRKLIVVASSEMAKLQIQKNHLRMISDCVKEFFDKDASLLVLSPEEKEDFIKQREEIKNSSVSPNEDENNFNEKYTFENFVVGNSNKFVYAAAKAVAEKPGQTFNPLFIYGGVGLGKTHLLHAIGNYVKRNKPKLKIKYVTCENFINDYISSMSAKNAETTMVFREKYRTIDILMVDDIQALANHIGTQEEFFNTFNDLYQNKKQIILSSDRPPEAIATLSERLISRCKSGLLQDILPPDYETKIAILKRKAQQEHYFITDEVISYIADQIDTNIREMEGMLNKVHFYATLLGKNVADIDDALASFEQNRIACRENLTMDSIIDAVCDYYKVSKTDILGKRKLKEIVEPRMVAIYLITDILGTPLLAIGKYFKKDHTTIGYARDKMIEQIKTDNELKNAVAEIKSNIRNN